MTKKTSRNTAKPAAKVEPKIHPPKVYENPLHFVSEEWSGELPGELKLAAETVNEKALNGLIMGPPTHETANLVCEMFNRCVWIVAPADVAEEKIWRIRITPGPVFNTPDACEVFSWGQSTTSGAAYHQGLAILGAALAEVAQQTYDVRRAFNILKARWSEKALTNLHRSIW